MNQAVTSSVKFVKKHRVAVAVVVTTSVFVALQLRNAKILNEFLMEHNLLDAFYAE